MYLPPVAKQRQAIVEHRETLIPRKPDHQEGKCKQEVATIKDGSYSGCLRLARKVLKNCVRTNWHPKWGPKSSVKNLNGINPQLGKRAETGLNNGWSRSDGFVVVVTKGDG